jgi:tetratricopeptide (TPR) repeat protein
LKSLLFLLICSNVFAADAKWQASVPKQAAEHSVWMDTTKRLRQEGMLFGALAASNHLISLFSDIASKELAYRTVIASIDAGYPVPVRDIFISGDLEITPGEGPEEYQFYNSYYLYKAILSQEKKVDHWAKYYFEKIDKENFPKYLFYQAVEQYTKGDLAKAQELLNTALSKRLAEQPKPLVVKMTRMLARLHFERGEYDKALDIYNSFLLKLNPMQPSDWLEAAWANFHLKKYPETLGLLYNLESKAAGKEFSLEKFNIRALTYRSTCATPYMDELIENFDAMFKTVLDGIKRGQPYEKFPELVSLELPENVEYNQTRQVVNGLLAEQKTAETWGGHTGDLAKYLYRTELAIQQRKLKSLQPEALNRIASQVLLVSEQMRFLKFDIQRAKYNPRMVFRPISEDKPRAAVAEGLKPDEFEIRWMQYGDYWLDERNKLRAIIVDRCYE